MSASGSCRPWLPLRVSAPLPAPERRLGQQPPLEPTAGNGPNCSMPSVGAHRAGTISACERQEQEWQQQMGDWGLQWKGPGGARRMGRDPTLCPQQPCGPRFLSRCTGPPVCNKNTLEKIKSCVSISDFSGSKSLVLDGFAVQEETKVRHCDSQRSSPVGHSLLI